MDGIKKKPFASLVIFASCAVLLSAGSAGAGTASLVDDTLLYEGLPGETNRVFVVDGEQGFRIIDLTAPVTPGAGCSAVGINESLCARDGYVPLIRIVVKDMDDFVKVGTALFDFVHIEGGAGADDLEGGLGVNVLDGGLGADVFRPSLLRIDVVDYSARTAPIDVTVGDGLANDGEAGEGDLIPLGIREVHGGQAGDTMSFSACHPEVPEQLFGRGGDDTLSSHCRSVQLSGQGGDDTLRSRGRRAGMGGGPGDDVLTGGGGSRQVLDGQAGEDRLDGRGGAFDQLYGGGGADRLIGGDGFGDEMRGGAGPDTIYARDGKRDRVFGNDGRDRARVDRALDRIRTVEEFF